MSKRNPEQANLIIGKIVLDPLKAEILLIQKGLNTIAKKYSFLHGNDVIATRQMLIDIFLTEEINDKDSDEVVVFDEQAFFDAIPEDAKVQIVEQSFMRFLSKISVEEIGGD